MDSGNSLLLDSTKPLPKLMLTNHKVLWPSYEGNFRGNAYATYHSYVFENCLLKIIAASPRGHWVKESLEKKSAFAISIVC